MAKYAVSYVEIYRTTYIIEAESYEDAEEKLRQKVENCEIEIDLADDFDHWETEPSDTFGTKEIPKNRDVSFYNHLEE